MKTIGLMPSAAGKKLPAAEWAGAVGALALICAGCGSPVPAGNSHNGNTGTLKVTVIEAGGPGPSPGGGGGTPTFPVANAEVKVTSASTSLSSRTGKAGVATFRLPGGSYLVSSPTCGITGKRAVTVTAPGSTSLTWTCPVP